MFVFVSQNNCLYLKLCDPVQRPAFVPLCVSFTVPKKIVLIVKLIIVCVCTSLCLGKTLSCSSENTERHSYSWYKNASESDRKPLAQTTTLKSEDKDSFDAWGAIVGLGSRSTSPLLASRDTQSSAWSFSSSSLLTKPLVETHITEVGQGDLDLPVEPSESQDHSQSLLRTSNCRTYCRPNKSKPSALGSTANSDGTGSAKTGNGEGKSRGRTRDYTVLHPSSMSACNVTIQDSMDRGMEEYTPSTPTADPGETGRLRKKAEPEAKPAR